MKLHYPRQFWCCVLTGLVLFAGTYPFYHDIYIAKLFTVICILLNAFSAVLFAVFLYCLWIRKLDRDVRGIFLWFIVLQSIAHGVMAIMNWASWLFLGLSVIMLALLAITRHKTNTPEASSDH